MKIFNSLKNILFEEVDDEKKEEVKKPIAQKIEPQKEEKVNNIVVEKPKEEVKEEVVETTIKEQAPSSVFMDFDEDEFSSLSRSQKAKPKTTTNVLEYEKKKKTEKKYDLGRYERIERTETVERKKFKPSPIISPVYGILNEDYKPEDIKNKSNKDIDFKEVRKKAFETPQTNYEEELTVKSYEDEEVKRQKVKTIDELLEDTTDITIDVPRRGRKSREIEEVERLNTKEEVPKERNKIETIEEKKEEPEDTLENDLFDLIDSMYDNREDGE